MVFDPAIADLIYSIQYSCCWRSEEREVLVILGGSLEVQFILGSSSIKSAFNFAFQKLHENKSDSTQQDLLSR